MKEKICLELQDNWKMWCGLLVIFLSTFVIACLTPYHSDDFSYYFQGIDFVKHYHHYMGWSGRLAADWTSGALLATGCHFLIRVVQSIVMTGYCYMIAAMPSRLLDKPMAWFMPLIIYVAYWISNVNLGQTTFWIVGSANYLFTNFYILCFLTFYYNHYADIGTTTIVKGFLLAILAGCTNENTSVMLICVMVASIVLLRWQKDDFQLKPALIYLSGVVIGTLLLLLAPGNYKRVNHPAFTKWRSLSWTGKIKRHFQRLGQTAYFLPIFIAMFLEWLVIKLSSNFRKNQILLLWASIYFLAMVGSILVMVASPGMPPRSYNGPLTFLLLSMSFLFYSECDNLPLKVFSMWQIVIGFVCFYIPSYVCVFTSYKVALVQNGIRKETIEFNKTNNIGSFSVPGYYFPYLLKGADKYDMYHSGAMAKYYDVSHIDKIDVDFDYSLLKTGKLIDGNLCGDATEKFDIYTADRGLVLRNGRVLVVAKDAQFVSGDRYLNLIDKESGEHRCFKLPKFVKIVNRYCSGINLDRRFKAERYLFEIR
ncbi:MAG: hypothetical protein KBS34_05595 [Phascolarctobacterium sp.]|nr:hypothetical protein [Candidatus Phascolarctobacterium equi]